MRVMGLALGALLVTKPHFFACLALPIGAMAATEVAYRRLAWRRRWAMAALWISPAALTGTVYAWTIWETANLYAPASASGHTLSHEIHWLKLALTDYYAGTTHDSFWGSFGWLDTPLVIKGSHATGIIHTVIQGTSLALLALTLLRLEQVGSRLLRVARAGRGRQAFRMAVSDPLVNSYFLFTVFMIVLYVRIENRFGCRGAKLAAADPAHAPGGHPLCSPPLTLRPSRLIVARAVLVGLVVYCVLGSYYAIPTLKHRYYAQDVSVTVFKQRAA